MGFNPRGHIEGQNAEELRYILLHKVASDPTAIAAVEGQFYYNTTSQVVKYRNSSAWVFLPYVTASLTTSALLQGTGYAISSFTNGTGSSGFIKVSTSSVPSVQQYVAFADINSSAICTSIVAPGDNITLTTEKAVVDYVTSQISAIPIVSPAGNDTEIQYNNAGNFGANASLTYNNTTKTLLLSNASGGIFPTFKIKNGGLEGYMWCEDDGVFYVHSTGGMALNAASVGISGTSLLLDSTNIYFEYGTPSKFLALTGAKYLTYLDAVVPADISGTANYLSKFTGTHTLGNSVLYESSSKIGINNTSPAYALDVKSQIAVTTTTELPTLSAELNTSPATWTCGTNWTNSGGGVYTCTAGSGLLSTTINATTGRRYLITWSNSGSMNNVSVIVSVGAVTFIPAAQNIINAADITAGATGALTISFQYSSFSFGTISNISIKELTPITSRIPATFLHHTSTGINMESRSNAVLYSTAIGLNSQGYLNTGVYNTSFGGNTLANITAGSYNVGVGYNTLTTLTTGSYNVGIGYSVLASLTVGNNNVGIGHTVLNALTSGVRNTGIGSGALSSVTTGTYNTAIGYYAGHLISTALGNVAIGDLALQSSVTGGYNIAIGTNAGTSLTGSINTIIGYNAGTNLTSSSYNRFLGYAAGVGITTGGYNTLLADLTNINALSSERLYQSAAFSTDSDLILIGYAATKQKLSSIITNSIGIGNYVRVYQDNQVVLGNDNITSTLLRGKVEIRDRSSLASNSLSEPTFATHTKWTEAGDIAYNITKFTYTHNTGSGSLEQTSANFGTAIKPNTWYKISYTITSVSGTGGTGTINATLNGSSITMYIPLGASTATPYIYLKSGSGGTPFGNLKFEITTTGARVLDITFAGIEEIIGGDLYVNNDIEQRRGTYQYFRQYFGTDTDGDWRTYCDGSGLYVEYRTGGAWVNKHTIST